MRSTHALFNIVLTPKSDDVSQGYSDVSKLLTSLEQMSGFTYTVNDTNEFVTILFNETIGDINQLGFNSNGQVCFSINILINYIGG